MTRWGTPAWPRIGSRGWRADSKKAPVRLVEKNQDTVYCARLNVGACPLLVMEKFACSND